MTEAIKAYLKVLEKEPEQGLTHFHLGVAYRKRYDSDHRQPEDFQMAVEHWGKALDIDPNQYIWRRRIQQYGPRLDKPYSFYDWVGEARREIMALAARGRSTFSELRWYPPMEAAKGSLSWVFRAKQPESVRTGP